jgi:hypothetical protein
VFLYLVRSKEHRRWLRTPWPYLAGLAALLVFSPVLYWNWKHDWASVLYQSRERILESRGTEPIQALQFVGIQALAFFALTLPLAGAAIVRVFRAPRAEEDYLFSCFLPIFLVFGAVSVFRPVHILWPMPGYLGLLVVMAGVAAEGTGKIASFYAWRRSALVLCSGAALVAVGLHLEFFLPGITPFQGLYGWAEVAARAREVRATLPESAFYLAYGRKYTCASQLAWQLSLPHEVHGAHLIGNDALQYEYWCEPKSMTGRDAVVVVEDVRRLAWAEPLLNLHFGSVERAGDVIIPVGRAPIRPERPIVFRLYIGRDYRPPRYPREK